MLNYEVKIESVEMFQRIEKALAGVCSCNTISIGNCVKYPYMRCAVGGMPRGILHGNDVHRPSYTLVNEHTFIRKVLEHFGRTDDEIRAGDMVDGVWERGVFHLWWRHYEVCRTDDKYVYLKDCFGDEHSYDRSIHTFKKIKTAGGLSSTTNNQDNGIFGESEGKGNGPRKGQAVRTGSITGLVAVGGKPAGDPIQARTGKGRLGCTQISLTAVGSEHL